MFAKVVCGLCAVALSAGAAMAGQPSTKSGTKADSEKVVCRISQDTGSRLGRSRVCKTVSQWTEQRRQTREAIDRIQNSRPASGN